MKKLFAILFLATLCSFATVTESGGNILCQTTFDEKFYALEEIDGKTYFVTYSRMHPTAAHTRTLQATTMDCNQFGAWAQANNLTVVKR